MGLKQRVRIACDKGQRVTIDYGEYFDVTCLELATPVPAY